jgi:hypothetical protein
MAHPAGSELLLTQAFAQTGAMRVPAEKTVTLLILLHNLRRGRHRSEPPPATA